MGVKNDKTIKAYRFFCEVEAAERAFTLEELSEASGWKKNTIKAYLSKKWHPFIKRNEEALVCTGLRVLSEDAFIRLHAQRTDLEEKDILRPRFTPVVDALLDKTRESALLAVQVYNNPLVSFRAPGYIVHMIIAYTALFHAIFERKAVQYWYTNDDGTPKIIEGDKQAWDISRCIKEYYGGRVLPEAENLKFFVRIRNKVEHRFVPALDTTLAGRCQSLLFNFERLLIDEFGGFFALGQSLALALQFSMFSQEQQASLRRIQSQEYQTLRQFIDDYDALLPDAITQSMQYSFRAFLIPKVGKHEKSSDIAIEFVPFDPNDPEEMERLTKQIVLVKEKYIPVADPGLLTAKTVAQRVRDATGVHFNTAHHTRAWKLYQVRTSKLSPEGCKTEYCQFSIPFKQFVYTEAWVRFLCEKVLDPEDLARISTFRDL
jgi:hypothetical protein